MRNFNTSFVKNAVNRFGNEASQVLRAFSVPASGRLRLMQSVVRTIWSDWVPTSYRYLQAINMSGTNADKGDCPPIDRMLSLMARLAFGREQGEARAAVLTDQRVS